MEIYLTVSGVLVYDEINLCCINISVLYTRQNYFVHSCVIQDRQASQLIPGDCAFWHLKISEWLKRHDIEIMHNHFAWRQS